jgi:transcriptional regulator with XRE-family HTH domain
LITGRQIRAARALLDISQDELAIAAGLTKQGISKIEDGSVQPREGTITDITRVFNDRGIEFTENEGVRRRPEGIEIFEGTKRFSEFYDFLYEHLKRYGGEVCIGNSDPQTYLKYFKEAEEHKKRMEELTKRGDVRFRILVKEGDQNFFSTSYAQYKWQPKENFVPTSFYAFGECLALISFIHQPAPYVILIKSGPLAEAYRQAFNVAWEHAKMPVMSKGE